MSKEEAFDWLEKQWVEDGEPPISCSKGAFYPDIGGVYGRMSLLEAVECASRVDRN